MFSYAAAAVVWLYLYTKNERLFDVHKFEKQDAQPSSCMDMKTQEDN